MGHAWQAQILLLHLTAIIFLVLHRKQMETREETILYLRQVSQLANESQVD